MHLHFIISLIVVIAIVSDINRVKAVQLLNCHDPRRVIMNVVVIMIIFFIIILAKVKRM